MHLVNAAEQSFGGLILLRRAPRLNGLQEALGRQSHHPVQQTQQEGHHQLEHTHRKNTRHLAKRAAAVTRGVTNGVLPSCPVREATTRWRGASR